MFTQTHINLHEAAADVLKAYKQHQTKVTHCYNALNNPGIYRHYTPQEYQSMMEASKDQMEEIRQAYVDMMKRMVSDIMNFNHIEEIEVV